MVGSLNLELRDVHIDEGSNSLLSGQTIGIRDNGNGVLSVSAPSTKGQKGQGAHNKHKKAGFEGGQTRMALRFPKFGFKNFSRKDFAEINVGRLNELEISGELTAQVLKDKKVIADVLAGLRVLGDGELKKAFTIKAKHFTATAKAKIEKAGGKAVVEA
jgi:large subunit ribosomal protein L15